MTRTILFPCLLLLEIPMSTDICDNTPVHIRVFTLFTNSIRKPFLDFDVRWKPRYLHVWHEVQRSYDPQESWFSDPIPDFGPWFRSRGYVSHRILGNHFNYRINFQFLRHEDHAVFLTNIFTHNLLIHLSFKNWTCRYPIPKHLDRWCRVTLQSYPAGYPLPL